MVWVGRELKGRLVPLPAVHRDTHSSSSAHSPNSLTWAVCRDGAPPPLWATCASASPPSVPNLLPHLHSQSPLLSSEAISPSPIADPTMESVPSLLTAPLDAGRPLSALLLLPSLLHAAQPQLSACPRREGFHPCHHFCVPPLDTALQQLHVSPALRTPPVDAVLQVRCHSAQQRGRSTSLPAARAALAAAQGPLGFLCCQGTLLAHVQLPPTSSPGPFWQGCAQSLRPPACTDSGCCHDPGADLALGFVEPPQVPQGPELSLSGSLWMES